MLRALVVPARCRPDRRVLHRKQQAKSTKAQVTMMLRRVLCVLFLALCCACVCATAQEEGQYDVAVVEAGEGQDQTTTTTTTTNNLLRRRPPPPMHPPRTHHLQGTDSWRRERPRRPFVGSGAAAAACQCRCGDRRCCVLRTGRGACAALGVTHRGCAAYI
ncbi:putative mucin TcSMUGS [Trypanosoma cruzi]|uniref:Putative mucin TcSMUGS n=1 Tax=Trypanosoma cruzi TaxID=5693 RepID=A0A2V2UFX3_TRYCR|nr:putative mucin TcSMUGS [Trypanosoma cruzi]